MILFIVCTLSFYKVEALRYFLLAAEQKYSRAMCNVAYCYEYGKGTEVNAVEAVRWYQRAVDQGNIEAHFDLGSILLNGRSGVPADIPRAKELIRYAAEEGYATSQAMLGALYADGTISEINMKEALKWYRLAADQGFSGGQHFLGHCYENGIVVKKDINLAKYWYGLAAAQGDEESIERLQQLQSSATSSTSP